MPSEYQPTRECDLDGDELIEPIHIQGRACERGGRHLPVPARLCHGWGGDGARQGLALPRVELIAIANQGQSRGGGILPPQ
jgi:hypothetical protein